MVDSFHFNPPTWSVEVKGLNKSFDDRPVLKDVGLQIKTGELVVVFGPNGAGKTTLIKILSTIMNFSSGTVLIEGLNARTDAEKVRSKIGLVSHNTFLYGNLTAYENLNFYRRLYDMPSSRITEVASMVGMESRLKDRINTLSRGMQQRFSIARALLHRPSVLLLDEPETGLDQQAVSLVWEVLRKSEGRRTVVLVTHNLERGLDLADRLLILYQGRIVYQEFKQNLNLATLKQAYLQNTRFIA